MEACSLLVNLRKGMQSSSEQPLVGEEHCVTTLITAAKETTYSDVPMKFVQDCMVSNIVCCLLFFKIYQIQQHPHAGVAVAVAAPQGTYIQQQGATPEQTTLTPSEAQQQQ